MTASVIAVVFFWYSGFFVATFDHPALCDLWIQNNATILHGAEIVRACSERP